MNDTLVYGRLAAYISIEKNIEKSLQLDASSAFAFSVLWPSSLGWSSHFVTCDTIRTLPLSSMHRYFVGLEYVGTAFR